MFFSPCSRCWSPWSDWQVVSFPAYPDRYPEWSRGLPAGRPRTLLVTPTGQGAFYEQLAQRQGARLLGRSRGVAFYDWPPK